MKTEKLKMMKKELAAWMVSWSQMFLMDQWSDWYKTNQHFRFKKGDEIKLKNTMACGYGIDPKGLVVDHIQKDHIGKIQDFYVIEMNCLNYDHYGKRVNWLEWAKTGKLPENNIRKIARQIHFKWNIEHHFKRCSGI